MGTSFYGELVIRITSDTKGLTAGLNGAAAQTEAAGKKMAASSATMAQKVNRVGMGMQNLGRMMTQFVTLPVAAGFAIAGVAAFKFQDTLMKIQNLTGTSAAQTKAWGEELIKLGGATGQTPLALGESLYFVASSGFKGAEAMSVINVAAKAAAAGMGDVMVTADVLTSAMNAYGHSAYSAAQVTDILMKTVEVGKAEPEQLASSLGRILPIANQLDVGLDELGGNVAALTLGGLSSAEAVTALRGTMVALVSPAQMSIDKLKDMGLSYQGVTKSIAKEGLLPTLKMLWEATDHNMLSMRKIIPNVRATSGVMSLLGANYKSNLKVIDQVTHAQGALDKAMKNTAEQTVQKLRVAWAQLQGSFIKIGAVVLPYLADFAAWLARVAESFTKLSPAWQGFILKLAAGLAVLGPVTMMLGSFLRAAALIGPVLKIGSIGALFGGAGAAGGAAGAAQGVAAVGTAAAGAAGPVIALGAAVVGLGAAIAIASKKHYDPTGENWKKSLDWVNRQMDKISTKKVEPIKVPIKLIGGKGADVEQMKAKLRMQGTIVVDADAVKAWVQMESLNQYVNDPSKWVIPLSSHMTPEETVAEFAKTIEQTGGAMAGHKVNVKGALQFERQQILKAIEVTNIHEKVPPVKAPFELQRMSDAKLNKYWKTLTPKQKLMISLDINTKKLPKKFKIDVEAETEKAQTRVDNLKRKLDGIGKPVTAELRARKEDLEAKYRMAMLWLAELDRMEANPTVGVNDQASGPLSGIQGQLDRMPSLKTIRVQVTGGGIVPNALGGLYKKPTVALVGEDGPEVILPLKKPRRMAQLIQESGIGDLVQPRDYSRRGAASPAPAAAAGGQVVNNYYSSVSVPGGTIVDQPQKLADRLAPYQAANMRVTAKRKQRGSVIR